MHGIILLNLDCLKKATERQRVRVGRKTKYFYEVEVLLEMIVIDRNLRFLVHPVEQNGSVLNGSGDAFCMVAAFRPGTQ